MRRYIGGLTGAQVHDVKSVIMTTQAVGMANLIHLDIYGKDESRPVLSITCYTGDEPAMPIAKDCAVNYLMHGDEE
jgi:hypothetical protein